MFQVNDPRALIILYTDASFAHQEDAGSWAFWGLTGRAPYSIVESGVIPWFIHNSTDAELYAIIAAIEATVHRWEHARGYRIYSDNRTALEMVREAVLNPPDCPVRRDVVKSMKKRIAKLLTGKSVECRWIKAHNGFENQAQWLNSCVDLIARSTRRDPSRTREGLVIYEETGIEEIV